MAVAEGRFNDCPTVNAVPSVMKTQKLIKLNQNLEGNSENRNAKVDICAADRPKMQAQTGFLNARGWLNAMRMELEGQTLVSLRFPCHLHCLEIFSDLAILPRSLMAK
jgi:hypothetical protein